MWDNNAWVYFYDNTTGGEPPFLIQDFVHALQPDARFIVMLRDPVERLDVIDFTWPPGCIFSRSDGGNEQPKIKSMINIIYSDDLQLSAKLSLFYFYFFKCWISVLT